MYSGTDFSECVLRNAAAADKAAAVAASLSPGSHNHKPAPSGLSLEYPPSPSHVYTRMTVATAATFASFGFTFASFGFNVKAGQTGLFLPSPLALPPFQPPARPPFPFRSATATHTHTHTNTQTHKHTHTHTYTHSGGGGGGGGGRGGGGDGRNAKRATG